MQRDSPATVIPGLVWLQSVGTLPLAIGDDPAIGFVSDATVTAYLPTRRLNGRRGRLLRPPRTLLVVGSFTNSIGFEVAADALADLNVDIVMSAGVNYDISTLLGWLPVTDFSRITIGEMKTGPGSEPAIAYIDQTVLPAAGCEGGQLYVAYLGLERMAFGGLSSYSVVATGSAGSPAAPTASSYHPGYTFWTMTSWSAGNDPGDQAFTGCSEVGRTDIPDLSVIGLEAGRIQVFFNGSRVSIDRAAFADYLARMDRLKVKFWGRNASTNGGIGRPTDPANLNPGDPTATALAIDGGLGVVSFQEFASDPASDPAAAWAAILADATSFFA